MSDNPQYGPSSPFGLPSIRLMRFSGRDAVAFAQAQFMNDVAELQPRRFQWNGWLNPKGRIQALFALLRVDDETLCLAGHFDADALAEALGRFRFRSRVAVEPLPEWRAHGAFVAPTEAHGAAIAVRGDGRIEADLSADGGPRTLLVGPAAEPATEDGDALDAWHAFDLAHGWPSIPGLDPTAWTPQQLSLERLAAFSVRKGCYPGQEIVARTHFLGRAKRGLALLEAEGLQPGDEVRIDDAPAGTVIAATRALAVAVLPTERTGTPAVHGRPVRERPFGQGLAR